MYGVLIAQLLLETWGSRSSEFWD